MLCRFGWSETSRPVRATVWLKVAWMRPSGADLGEQALAVGRAQLLDLAVAQQVVDDRVLAAQLLERGGVGGVAGLGLLLRGQAELVEQDRPQLRRGVDVELDRRPRSWMAARARSPRSPAGRSGPEVVDVDADADALHPGQHPHQRPLDVVVQVAQALGVERRGDGRRPAGRRPPRAGRPRSAARSRPRRGRAALGAARPRPPAARARRSAAAGPGAGSATRPGRAGRRRARCRGRGCARRRRGSSSARISALAPWAASGRPPSATERAAGRRARRRRPAGRPAARPPRPGRPT